MVKEIMKTVEEGHGFYMSSIGTIINLSISAILWTRDEIAYSQYRTDYEQQFVRREK